MLRRVKVVLIWKSSLEGLLYWNFSTLLRFDGEFDFFLLGDIEDTTNIRQYFTKYKVLTLYLPIVLHYSD